MKLNRTHTSMGLLCVASLAGLPAQARTLAPWLPFGYDGVASTCYEEPCERYGMGLVVQQDRRLLYTGDRAVRALDLESGDLDRQFQSIDASSLGAPADSLVAALATFPDGSLVTAVQSSSSQGFLQRLDADGAPVPGFNRASGVYRGLVALPDGRFLAYRTDPAGQYQVWRFGADGRPDASFGSGGLVWAMAEDGLRVTALAADSDGRVWVVGSVTQGNAQGIAGRIAIVLRLLGDGRPDTSFGNQGHVRLPFDGLGSESVAGLPEPDGSVVVVANAARVAGTLAVAALVRLDPTGRIDSSFGEGGTSWPGDASCGGVDYEAQSALRLASGGIVVAAGGWKREGSSPPRERFGFTGGAALLGLEARGARDVAFGACGIFRYFEGANFFYFTRVQERQGDLYATAVYVPPTFYRYFDYEAEIVRLSFTRASTAGRWQAAVDELIDRHRLQVTRYGGDVGRVALHFATEDGTAVAGRDYVATSGTLVWEDGVVDSKNASIARVASACALSATTRPTFTLKFDTVGGSLPAPQPISVPMSLPLCPSASNAASASGSASATAGSGGGGGGAFDLAAAAWLAAYGLLRARRGIQRRSRSASGNSTSG